MLQIKNYKSISATDWLSMVASEAIGLPLVQSGCFAADMLDFGSQQKTSLHTHPGSHILFIVSGHGWLDYDDQTHDLELGTCYFVPGSVAHRIRSSKEGLTLLSVSNDHRPVNSSERVEVLDV